MKKAFVHFADGFEEIEAITITDVLRRAAIPVVMVSVTGKKEVTGNHGITVSADILFEEADYSEAEILILPGGQPGANNLNSHEGLKKQLTIFNGEKKKIGAICAAPLILGGLDILKGKKAVCFPGYENHLKGAEVISEPAVVSENIFTGRGPGAALDFSLNIVAAIKGRETAESLSKAMLVTTWK